MDSNISFMLSSSLVLKKEVLGLRKWAARVSQCRRRELRLWTNYVKSQSLRRVPSLKSQCESPSARFHMHINNAVIIWFRQLLNYLSGHLNCILQYRKLRIQNNKKKKTLHTSIRHIAMQTSACGPGSPSIQQKRKWCKQVVFIHSSSVNY